MIESAMLSSWLAIKAVPTPDPELAAVTYFLNFVLISSIMLLVFIAILHKEVTRRNAARRVVELEENVGRIIEPAPGKMAIDARLTARNHGSVPAYLRRIDYSIYLDGHRLEKSSQAAGIAISPGPAFALARTLDLPMMKTSLGARPCMVKGTLHLDTSCGPTTVPFAFEAVEGAAPN